jgi:hypothetical protein
LYWEPQPFATASAAPVPTVVGWSSAGNVRTATPSMLAGSLIAPLRSPRPAAGTTIAPAAIGGLDLPTSFAVCGVLVYATVLSASQMKAAALRLAYVGFGEVV